MKRCHRCKTEWKGINQPPFRERCRSCGEALHACLNCRHHDPTRRYECLEPIEDRVGDKAAFNLCEEFQFLDDAGGEGEARRKAEARKRFDKLF